MASNRYIARPMYEARPWIYLLCGLLALVASYRLSERDLVSPLIALCGIGAVLYGSVVLLRRRDFRQLRAHYSDQGELSRSRDE